MTPVKPPPEPGRTRRQKAAATRSRMVASATSVFVAGGYAGARMADIAADAGVAVQTLYYTYSTKADLLAACLDAAVLGPEGRAPTEQEFWQRAGSARTAADALAAYADGLTAILGRVAAMDEVVRGAVHEPGIEERRAHGEALRREGYHAMVGALAERFGLRTGLDVDAATDVAMAVASGPSYLALTRSGWTRDRYADWLADALGRLLLDDR